MFVTESARRHGWGPEDIRWAVGHAVLTVEVATAQPEAVVGILHLGPARDGRFLEVLVIMNDAGEELAIHAMPIRSAYRRMLREGRR